ncbi:X-ray radiation resistance-associated protein 1-like isoform X2 [Physella acuta]|uniref:X-ray radiation resistance-associated protein 1-like isoform X2 n=1 Tax=Physella acuta TaxID=109671 RepID=UPI0027DBC334|nr:X-ray radiation resistance-associated protein 1-like isoform X2 [Physella acuta]
MALAGVKFDDGQPGFVPNCFPVRPIFGHNSNDGGKWLVVQHEEQQRRFNSILCAKPRTYSRIKEERKKSERLGTKLDNHSFNESTEEKEDEGKILDGFFLMKHSCVEDPSDLCSVNVANQELVDVKEEDMALFENVAYVNAGENYLPFEAFRGFPSLRELELPLNGLRSLKISHTDFSNLEMLDLSYNNLSQDDLLNLGLLVKLKVLHLTGNNFSGLPQDLAMPYLSRERQVKVQRFACLEVLLLDDNKLKEMTVFAALAGLPKLRHLNLSKNELYFVPQLKSVEGRVITQDGKDRKRSSHSSHSRTSRKSSRQSKQRNSAKEKTEGQNDDSSNLGETRKTSDSKDLLADDFSTADLSARIEEFDEESTTSALTPHPELDGPQVPPFPELRYLNLANNNICEEDALLAVAAWPLLAELDVYDNPLTTDFCGDPPLLKRFLQDRLGIKLNRKKPQEGSGFLKKGKVEIHPKPIKITDRVPKVPKVPVEEKMMLEPPPSHKAIHGSSTARDTHDDMGVKGAHQKPVLPPIQSESKDEVLDAWIDDYMEKESFEEEQDGREEVPSNASSDQFFMTQLDDMGEKRKGRDFKASSLAEKSFEPRQNKTDQAADSKYRGYEDLLNIEDLDDEPILPPAKDIQGNIRTLKHTLNHLLVYRDPAVELTRVKKMVPEYRRVPVVPSKPTQTYQEKVDDVLAKLKARPTFEEEKLTNVLTDKKKFQNKFPEAQVLLGQIQRRYNAVRVASLKDAKTAQEIHGSIPGLVPTPPAKAKLV